MITEQFGSDF